MQTFNPARNADIYNKVCYFKTVKLICLKPDDEYMLCMQNYLHDQNKGSQYA